MRIVVTRLEGRGVEFIGRLESLGHVVCRAALTRVVDAEPFPDPALFDGVLFTSVSAVERSPSGAQWPRVGAVGRATAAALKARGIDVAVVGGGGGADLARAWGEARGQKLLLPLAADAHPALGAALEESGAEVVRAVVYRTLPLPSIDETQFRGADVICFFAPSAVQAYVDLNIATNAQMWAHGPTTADALRRAGYEPSDLEF
jgi:uroporphyrinogen-III synthase